MKTSRVLLLVSTVLGFAFLSGCDSPANVHLGDQVNISYIASFADGSAFETSGVQFRVGSGQVIAGLDEGVLGMKAGETKSLTISPNKGYGKLYSPMRIQKISKLIFDKIKTSLTGNMIQIGSLQGVVKGEETDGSGNTLVLIDINPRQTWDTLVYKVTLIEKK